MELIDAINRFKVDLEEVKRKGLSTIEVEAIDKYLDYLATQASLSRDERQMLHANNLAHYAAQNAVAVEHFKSVIEAGKEAVNASIIINGGAVIALMAFLGNVASKLGRVAFVSLAEPLLCFGIGVLCGGVAFGTRYISQFLYASPKTQSYGHVFNASSWLLTFGAFVGFGVGSILSYRALTAL